MTTFKGIRGTAIQVVSSDPSNPEEGQIWYNSSSGTLKGYKTVNTWASGGNLNTGRYSGASAGTQTAALGFGGNNGSNLNNTESYNGSAWTAVNVMNTARYTLGGVGTQTAALGFAGYTYPPAFFNNTESWNGTSWTAVDAMNTSRSGIGSAGTQTAALGFGGSGPVATGVTESWNGTSWTTLPASMNTARGAMGSTGTQTAALGFGGTPYRNVTESWNGSAWTNLNNLNTPRQNLGSFGTQTSAAAFGAQGATSTTELWNGTSWTANPTGLGTARAATKGAGTVSAGLAFFGQPSAAPTGTATEAWTGVGIKTITVS